MAEKLDKETILEIIESEFDHIRDSAMLNGSFVNYKVDKIKNEVESL